VTRHVAVVGAGIAGLTAAYLLRDSAKVTVLDAAPTIGGKVRTSDLAGLPVDEGAEQFLVRTPEVLDLCTELGLQDELVHPRTTSASVWSRGRLRAIPPRTLLGIPSSLSSLRDLLTAGERARAAMDYVLPAPWPSDDVAVGEYVESRLGRAVVDRLVDPLLGGVYAGSADDLSLHATVPQLGAVRGSLMVAVRDTIPAPSNAPVFATLRSGLQRLSDRLAKASGARIRTRHTVRSLHRRDDGFELIYGPNNAASTLTVDAVVLAVPSHPAARLLAGVVPTAATELAAIDTASVAIVTLAYAAATPQFDFSRSGYLVPAVESGTERPVKAVTLSSAKWAHLDGDVAIVRCSLGRYGDAGELQRDDAELIAAADDEVRRFGGVTGTLLESRLTRWGGALPQYTVGHRDRIRRIRAAVATVPGLAVCGAVYDGVGLPACIRSARSAVEALQQPAHRT
jgi:oxygen-dependent protoporphyrinogen oxidase